MRVPYLIATAAYCALIWRMSADPTPPKWELPWQIEGLDKLVHVLIYGVLTVIVSVGMRRSGRPVAPWTQCFAPIVFAGLYGLTDEVHQLYVPNRSFDLGDLFADIAGAALVQCALCYLYWRGSRTALPVE